MQTRLSRQQAASTGGTRTNHGIRQRNSRAPTRTCAAAVDGAASTSLPPLVAVDDSDFGQRHAFTDWANWIIPGYLMVGQYPFVDPHHVHDRTAGEERLKAILNAGLVTFVCLQAELPPQTEMPARGVDGFAPYKATAELIASSLDGPPPSEVVEGLRNPYLDQYVPPRRRQASESYQAYNPMKLHFVSHGITDLSLPEGNVLQETLDDVSQRLENGEKVYMHCWGGRGRSGLVAACLLQSKYGISADESLQHVQQAFQTRGETKHMRVPETDEQVQFVKDFGKTR